jgi:hypothetical protein
MTIKIFMVQQSNQIQIKASYDKLKGEYANVMQENLKKYEDAFGPVESSEAPTQNGIGFRLKKRTGWF